ncbi:cation:proton antiporter [Salinisphaera aquimarina]|uniref:Cation:proton antiporter n=1 Tax=Salinisphaera aquimarina TaxID=2094031 RepID=A0ABV7EQG9_9GAMM
MEHHLSLILITIVALGVFSQWIAWSLKIPAIVMFLVSGVVAGPVLGILNPSDDIGPVLSPLVGLSVAVILFEGGLSLRLHEFKEAASGVKRLVSVGAALSWMLYTLAAYYIGHLSLPVSLLFGAILIVTGPTVIIPMLRQAGLNRRTASYLKWEGIINDPIGALLAVLVFQYFVFAGADAGDGMQVFVDLGWAILISFALGGGVAWMLATAFNHIWVPEYLKAPLTFAFVLVIYGLASEIFAEAGLLAVTVMGMVMGNMTIAGMAELRRFKEYITILMVSTVFIVLTSDLDPNVLLHLDWHAAALVFAVLFIVRPAAVLLSTLFTDMNWRDRTLVAWIAPRGIVAAAVAGVFGPRMVEAGYGGAEQLLPLIFAIVFSTVILHGFSIGRVSRWLRLSAEPNGVLIVGASPWSTELARALTNELNVQVLLVDSSWHRLRTARLAGVRVLYGEVLSDQIQQSLELNEISCLLAATSNDAYNALVCSHFVNSLEHNRVFQLPMYAADESNDSKVVARPLRGLPAFHEDAQYEELWRRHFQNWQFYKTRITDSYTREDFRRDCPTDAVIIATLYADSTLLFNAASGSTRPDDGDTVIYYAPKKDSSERRKARAERAEAASERSAAVVPESGSGAQQES